MTKLVKIALQDLAEAADGGLCILGEGRGLALQTRLVRLPRLLGEVIEGQGDSPKLSERLSQEKISWRAQRRFGPHAGPNDGPHPHADG
ncbi:hypothetical protein [Phenylobacterium sp.]|jgi:hypothetical protein|uniref:hypothetical protein n=1 Tax=Phenylobacterium sp. TaxID=1871053 RepID=UPI000C94E250|nr:hypothetical protein [Phenylobacterium sp.]MAK81575.1 hypothetical protein [Phenylobacterium sp.]|tara:strand:+ start:85368 stop:85634 length:267 start_codon:yes stop_codon:yes gene_type:complete